MYRSTYSDSYGRRSNYPSYGYYDDSYVNYGYYNPWNSYYYGYGDRMYPHYWERDDYSRYRRNRRSTRNRSDRTQPEPPPEKLAEALKVTDIDMLVEENAKTHHTRRYHCVRNGQPVLRRGFLMVCGLTFDREYDIETTDAKIQFTIGENPSPPKGTQVVIDLIEKKKKNFKPDEWGASLVEKDGKYMKIQIQIPNNCIIGPWNMTISTFVDGNKDEHGNPIQEIFNKEYKQDIIILFNPWCKDDDVHMVPESNLKEYILNDTGCVFQGSYYQPRAKPWVYAQFQEGILDAVMYLLLAGYGGEPNKLMSDPVQVSRRMAAMVNVHEDNGVLIGKWAQKVEDYADGTVPWKWAGSKKILDEFMNRDGEGNPPPKKPVKYAQCWVFSAVLTTVCRVLGIPCRSVTNYSSAHDTDESNTIDAFRNPDGEESYLTSDSVWNYHVWNEVWLDRKDLEEKGMKGWNVIDSTPQELSGFYHTCGPCPVTAVKKGMCNVQYDTGFVFSEVNADRIVWIVHPGGTFEKVDVDKNSVGKGVWTRDPNDDGNKGMNVNHEYKFEEGSKGERDAVEMAMKTARFVRDESTGHYESMDMECSLDHPATINVGEDMEITFTIRNKGAHRRTVERARILVMATTYSGETDEPFFNNQILKAPLSLKPKEEKKFSVRVKMSDYMEHLNEQELFQIRATGHIPEENTRPAQSLYKDGDLECEVPELKIKGPRKGSVDEILTFTARFVNPLNTTLTECDMTITSSGFEDLPDVKQKDVPAGGTYEGTFQLKLIKSRQWYHFVSFSFDSKELKGINGKATVMVEDDEEGD